MIIDTHVHIGKIREFDLSESDVIYSMDRYGIAHSIVSSLNAVEFDHDMNPVPAEYQRSQTDCLDDVLNFVKKYPSRLSAAVWVKPHGEKADDMLYNAVKENLKYIKAFKFHPFHSNEPFDSEKTAAFIDLAENFSLPVVIHTGGSDAASCKRVYNMAKKFPKTNFFMVHMGLGTDNNEAIELISMLPNLYGDTTWVPLKSTLKLIKKAGIGKTVFGSDNPIDGKDTYLCSRHGDRSLYQEYFNELKDILSKDDYDRLMYKNAAELFKIEL